MRKSLFITGPHGGLHSLTKEGNSNMTSEGIQADESEIFT